MGVMKQLRGFLVELAPWVSMRHFQGMCAAVVVMVIGALMDGGIPRTDNRHVMIHVGSFAACLGAQLWVILVAGMTMFFILPRHLFGKLQTFLFPMFFMWCLVFSGLSLVTLNSAFPPHVTTDKTQMTCLSISFIAAAINCIVLAPLIIDSMTTTFDYEVKVGAGHIVGHADIQELKQNPGYAQSYRMFRRCHGISSLLNVISLLANGVYLSYLSGRMVLPLELS